MPEKSSMRKVVAASKGSLQAHDCPGLHSSRSTRHYCKILSQSKNKQQQRSRIVLSFCLLCPFFSLCGQVFSNLHPWAFCHSGLTELTEPGKSIAPGGSGMELNGWGSPLVVLCVHQRQLQTAVVPNGFCSLES